MNGEIINNDYGVSMNGYLENTPNIYVSLQFLFQNALNLDFAGNYYSYMIDYRSPDYTEFRSIAIGDRPHISMMNYIVRDLQEEISGGLITINGDYIVLTSDSYNVEVTAPDPEPSSWAMMMSGFVLVGHSLRRQVRRSRFIREPHLRYTRAV